jgi:hypothetical protein
VAGIREAARLVRYLVVKRSLQVVGRSPHAVRFVVVMAEAAIAFPAQQAPHLAGLMTMVDVELATLLLANPTNAPLTGQKCVQIVRGDAVAAFLPARLDFVLVCYSPTLIYPEPFLSKFRVLRISLFLPNGLAGNHVCFPPQPIGEIAGEIARQPVGPRPAPPWMAARLIVLRGRAGQGPVALRIRS